MVDKTTAISKAKHFVEDCKKNGLPIASAWLFGSYAKDNQRDTSDIDLALISDKFTYNFLDNNHQTALLNWEYPDIEVHHFNTKDFQWDTSPFINEIIRTGIKIYG